MAEFGRILSSLPALTPLGLTLPSLSCNRSSDPRADLTGMGGEQARSCSRWSQKG